MNPRFDRFAARLIANHEELLDDPPDSHAQITQGSEDSRGIHGLNVEREGREGDVVQEPIPLSLESVELCLDTVQLTFDL